MEIVSIVEGHGEVKALPIVVRRFAQALGVFDIHQAEPIRVHRDRFIRRESEFARYLALATSMAGIDGRTLILLDADRDCPRTMSEGVVRRARLLYPHAHISVVIANKEFEAWFIASANSLNGKRGFALKVGEVLPDCEEVLDAKGWIGRRMSGSYSETIDQAAFAASMDLTAARTNSRSFQKLCKELDAIIKPHKSD